MSGLRRSSGLTNLVADTLRFRDLSGGFLTLSDRGVVRNDSSPALQNLTVSGQTFLFNTTVSGTLTANSVNALVSVQSPYAAIGHLDASSASIDSIDFSSAVIGHLDASSAYIGHLDASSAFIGHLDASSAFIGHLDASSAFIGVLDISAAYIEYLDVSAAVIGSLDASSAFIGVLDVLNANVNDQLNCKDVIISGTLTSPSGAPLGPPVGSITMFAGSTAPAGWHLCDGSNLNISIYPALFAVIGTVFGGNGVTVFRIPDMRSRFPIGASNSFPMNGIAGGNESTTLTTDNLPAHQHGLANVVTNGFANHTHRYGWNFDSFIPGNTVDVTAIIKDVGYGEVNRTGTTGIPISGTEIPLKNLNGEPAITDSTGSGLAFSIMPPFLAINYIIKY